MSDRNEAVKYTNREIDPFGANTASHIAYKRTERLVTATHLVTNFVPENEPLRIKVRKRSVQLLKDVLELRDGFRAAGPERVNTAIARLLELATLFEIANAAGYLSQMNATVLRRACRDLALFLRHHEDERDAEGIALSDSYFVPLASPKDPHGKNFLKDINKGQKAPTGLPRKIKDKKSKALSASRSARHTAVLNFVREKGRVSVKELAQAVSGYSEKTLQRELSALVRVGVLRKEGERRWSTYVLMG